MLKLKKKQKYNKNHMCLGEVIKGDKKGERIYYIPEDEKEENIDLEEKFNIKYVRRCTTDITLDDIKMLETCIKENKECPPHLKECYKLLLDERNRVRNNKVVIDGQFQCFPDLDIDLDKPFVKSNHMYVAGATGSGKSYWIADYLKLVNKYQKDREIFIFSDVDYDEAFAPLKNITRITLDASLITEPITPEELKDSVCIFDDIDSIQNKALKKTVYALMNAIYRRGRHNNITCISTTHNITEYTKSRTAINESSVIVLFCRSGSVSGQRYILNKYVGLDKHTINDILKTKSRSVQIHKSYPMFYSFKNGLKLID